ncbi:hypothetical protein [Humibacter ginsengiterrae]
MGRLNRTAHRLTSAIEGASALDAVADPLSGLVVKATKRKAVKNLLSGTWLGHALHPMLTDVPIGFWSAALLLDVTAGERGARSARRWWVSESSARFRRRWPGHPTGRTRTARRSGSDSCTRS